jgi:phosphonoacetaldehyde hydrolase
MRGMNRVQAVVLDWSGTVADNWVIAPARAFVDVFNEFRVPITMEEARGPMGLRKDLHIRALLQIPVISSRWKDEYGRLPDLEKDLVNLMKRFNPLQMACLPEYCTLIPGAAESVHRLRKEFGVKIGATTGFMRPMVDILLQHAKRQGYEPDVNVAGDEVSKPRPYPYMVWANMSLLGILSPSTVVKVDDTSSGVGEGLNAKTWTVGLSHTSNYMNINRINHGLSQLEFARRGQYSRSILIKAGAHYVIPDITYLPNVITDINRRMIHGELPTDHF